MAAAATTQYEDFDPKTETETEKDCDTILLHVPGFKKGQLRVQLTSTKMVRVSGEKETEAGKSLRFRKEFPVTPNVDTNRISAKFEKGILYVKLPKVDDQQQETAKTAETADSTGKESDQVSDQKKLNDDTGNANYTEGTAATTASSEISPRLSRRAIYAVLVGLVAVVVAVGLYFTNIEKYQT